MRGRSGPGDGGSTHVLEAVIIATIMLSAVAFVATFEAPPIDSSPSRELLQQKADDALSILYDTPVSGTLGTNLLSADLAQCLQGNCTPLSSKLDGLLPVGTSYALYVSNGYDTFPVYVTKSPPGEAVTARRLVEPRWSYTWTSSAMTNVNNATDPADIYSLPVFDSNVVAPGGSPLKVVVQGTRVADGSDFVLEGFYTTQAVSTSQALQYPAASLNFLVNRTTYEPWGANLGPGGQGGYFPGAFWDRYNETMNNQTGWPNNQSVRFDVQLNETAGVSVPVGTFITVDVPRGWNASGWNNATWQVLQNATDWNASYNGSQVIAELLQPVNNAAVNFTFNATYHGDMLKYYTFHAALSHGADAEANVVVVADGYGDQSQTFVVPSVKMSVPRPMGSTANTTWSLVVNVPYTPQNQLVASKQGINGFSVNKVGLSPQVSTDPNNPGARLDADVAAGSAINITNITIYEQDHNPIFKAVYPGRLSEGTWQTTGDQLQWTGSHSTFSGPLNLTFYVIGSGVAGSSASRSSIVPPVSFDGWQGKLIDQLSPGLYRDGFLPNNTTGQDYNTSPTSAEPNLLGYQPDSANLSTPLQHDYSSNSVYRGQSLAGVSNYSVNQLSPLHDSIYGSYVNVNQRSIPIGGQVVITADVQSILYALSEAGESAGVTLTFYPPWAGDAHVPIWEQDNLDSTVVQSDYSALCMLDVNGDGYADPVFGTSQGRVFALDATTGARLQGNAWAAPVLAGNATFSAITAMKVMHVWGKDYIAVGTDASSGVYLLDKTFNQTWWWNKPASASASVVALDTSTDFDGSGQPELAVDLSDSSVWVLGVPSTPGSMTFLGAESSTQPFYQGQGTPSAFATLTHMGLANGPGLVVSLLNKPGPTSKVTLSASNPAQPSATPPQLYTNAPRAGMDAVDSTMNLSWTFTAGPITKASSYGDYAGTGATDVVAGSSAGFVVLLNGTKGVGPMAGAALTPAMNVTAASGPTIQDAALVSSDGGVYFTHDRWNTIWCLNCDPTQSVSHVDARLRGVALNNSGSMWLVGVSGVMYRSVADPLLGQSWAVPVTPNVTWEGLPVNPALVTADYRDVYFRFGPSVSNEGWVVGAPPSACGVTGTLSAICGQSTILHTTNGGGSWTALDQGSGTLTTSTNVTPVTATLTRINFTNPSLGWAVGTSGTLLRTQDGGQHWKGLAAFTSADVNDVSCAVSAPDDCLVATADGHLWSSANANQTTPVWVDITSSLGSGWSKVIRAVGVVDPTHAYLGASNVVLATWNGGANWSALPMGYVPNDIYRMTIFPDGTGYTYGGNATNGAIFWMGAYLGNATYQTGDLTVGANALPAGAVVWGINVTASTSTTNSAQLQWNASADGGADWTPSITGSAPVTQQVEPGGVTLDLPAKWISSYVANPAQRSNDVRIRATLNTTPDAGYATPQILGTMQITVAYRLPSDVANETATFTVDLTSNAMMDPSSTAVWNASLGSIAAPTVGKFWVTNVSGAVQDLQTGYNVTGDGHNDVWVATGGILTLNSPDYQVYAANNPNAFPNASSCSAAVQATDPTGCTNDTAYVNPDDRVYLLDGATGAIVARSQQFPGEVWSIRLANATGGSVPDTLYAVVYNATASWPSATTWVYALNPKTLQLLADPTNGSNPWQQTQGSQPPVAFEVTRFGMGSLGVLAVSSTTTTSGSVGSDAYGYSTALSNRVWATISDARGHYIIQKDIPTSWFFGPYVVEVRVDWQDRVTGTDPTTGYANVYSVLQSARFYDYFMVTPPDALAPASPVYDVQLVAWQDDWH